MLITKHVTKNKVDDRYMDEVYEIINQIGDSQIYTVKGIETSIIKRVHRDNIIMFKRSEMNDHLVTTDTVTTWHDMKTFRNVQDDMKGEYEVSRQLNKKIAIYFGDANHLTAEHVVIPHKTIANTLSEKLQTMRRHKLADLVIAVDREPSQRSKSELNVILEEIRKELHHKNWRKIIIVSNQPVNYNKLIECMLVYFPKIEHRIRTIIEDSTDTSDSEQQSLVEHIQPDSTASDESSEETSTEHSDTDSDQEPPRGRYNLRKNRQPPDWYGNVVHSICL